MDSLFVPCKWHSPRNVCLEKGFFLSNDSIALLRTTLRYLQVIDGSEEIALEVNCTYVENKPKENNELC